MHVLATMFINDLHKRYTGGVYGQEGSSRISLEHTRAIVDAIHNGSLADSACSDFPVFRLQVV